MKKLLLALAVSTALTGCIDTGTGEKVGIVTKAAVQGVFCKTMEVEIMRGGLNGGSGVVGKSYDVTVSDKAVFEKLQKAMETQQEVKIKYRTDFITWCSSDSPHNAFLTDVEFIEPTHKAGAPVTPGTGGADQSREKIIQLLAVQAQLLQELAAK